MGYFYGRFLGVNCFSKKAEDEKVINVFIKNVEKNINKFIYKNQSILGKDFCFSFDDTNLTLKLKNIELIKILDVYKLLKQFVDSGAFLGSKYHGKFNSLTPDDYDISITITIENDEIINQFSKILNRG